MEVFVQDLGQFRILPGLAIFCDVGTWLLWISIILFTKFHKIPPSSHPRILSLLTQGRPAGQKIQNLCLEASCLGIDILPMYWYPAKEFKTITLFNLSFWLDVEDHVEDSWQIGKVVRFNFSFVSQPELMQSNSNVH